MAMKQKITFKEERTQDFPSPKRRRTEFEVDNLLSNYFSFDHGERSDLKDNVTSGKQPNAMKSTSPWKRITNIFTTNKSKERKVAAAKAMFVFHSVKHHHPYKSMTCTSKLLPETFGDSKMAKTFSMTEINSEAVVNNAISPCIQWHLKENLDKCQYIGVSTEVGTHKIFPVIVQYFDKEEGVQSKVLELAEFKNEDPDRVSAYLYGVLIEKGIDAKITSFGDNTNFECLARKGENSIFSKLQCKLGRSIVEVGCPGHILHNSIQAGVDHLPVDVESVILKVYKYLSIYNVRVASLTEYCAFVNETYQDLLTHVKTQWLGMFPAIERFVQMFQPLKSYFLSLDKCPVYLKSFFSDEAGEAYFWFLHGQMSLFQNALRKIEENGISVNEVRMILLDVSKSLRERQKLGFVTWKAKRLLADLPKKRAVQVEEQCMSFYENVASDLAKWSESLSHVKHFDWVLLQTSISWDEVEYTFKWLCENSKCDLHEAPLIDQFVKLKSFVTENQTDADFNALLAHKKWVRFFKSCASEEQYSELLKITQFYFSLPGHNANVERVFSLINAQWTHERDPLSLPSMRAMLDIQYNMANVSCIEFYNLMCRMEES